MNIDFAKLINLSYLFETRPNPESQLIFVWAIVFALAVLASGLVWIALIRKENSFPPLRSIRDRVAKFFFAVGFIGLVLVFFRWQGIPFFSMRAWLLLWLVIALIWTLRLLVYLLKKYPKERRVYFERLAKERYLPKPKKGKAL